MAVSNGIIYVNDAVTPNIGISVDEVRQVLGAAAGEELTSHANIKKWSRYKPFQSSTLFKTVAETQAAAKAANYGLVRQNGDPLLVANESLVSLFNAAMSGGYCKWSYLKPRGLNHTEWARLLDFAGYNHNAVNPPINVTFTPDPNDRTKATMTFQYPDSGSAYDLHIRDFPWFVNSVSGADYNWKYGVLYSQNMGNAQTVNRIVTDEDDDPYDIYLPNGNYVQRSSPRIGASIPLSIQRGRRRFFVPFITQLPAEGQSAYANYTNSVFLHTDSTDIFSIPQTVTTRYFKNVWFANSPTIYGNPNWSDLYEYGGQITVQMREQDGNGLEGIIIEYNKENDSQYNDIEFRLASNYGSGDGKVTDPVDAVFYSQTKNTKVSNYYDSNGSPDSETYYNHGRPTFTIDQHFFAIGSELYLQVYDGKTGDLLDEIFIQSVPFFNV